MVRTGKDFSLMFFLILFLFSTIPVFRRSTVMQLVVNRCYYSQQVTYYFLIFPVYSLHCCSHSCSCSLSYQTDQVWLGKFCSSEFTGRWMSFIPSFFCIPRSQLDCNCKRWRWVVFYLSQIQKLSTVPPVRLLADILNDGALFLELCSPFVPNLFVPMVCVADVLRVSYPQAFSFTFSLSSLVRELVSFNANLIDCPVAEHTSLVVMCIYISACTCVYVYICEVKQHET